MTEGEHKEINDSLVPTEVETTSLDPIFSMIVEDQLSYVKVLIGKIDEYCDANPTAKRVPRSLGDSPFTIRGCSGSRKLATFVSWKAQRVRNVYLAAIPGSDDKKQLDLWLVEDVCKSGVVAEEIIPKIENPLTRLKGEFKEVLELRAKL